MGKRRILPAVRPLRSLGYRSDRFFVARDGEVIEREGYTVFKSPANPDFWWGNLLLYPDPPGEGASRRGHPGSWLDDFDRELPGVRCCLLAWDRPDGARGALDGFVAQGFEIDESSILTADRVTRSARHNRDVRVVRVGGDAAWREAAAVLVAAYTPRRSGTLDDLSRFVTRQMTRYRAIADEGLGCWYLAHLDGAPAAVLGVVRQGDLGRFQLVGTDPRFARRGACSTLVFEVGRAWLAGEVPGVHGEGPVNTLVMAADADYHAARVYESVGFARQETLFAVIKRPPPG